MQRSSLPLLALVALLAASCFGTKTGDGNSEPDPTNANDPLDPANPGDPSDPADPADPADPTDPTDPVTPPDPEDPTACGIAPEVTPLRRLTRGEYTRTVRDLLGDTTRPGDTFPPDEEVNGFTNNADALTISQLLTERYQTTAEELAQAATADLMALTGCAPEAQDDACATAFIASFGERAYRRPLTDDEKDRLFTLFDAVRAAEGTFQAGVEAVVEGLLQSPHFLYRVELGAETDAAAGARVVEGYEMASRLSYFLWGLMPDDELLQKAADGELSTPAEVAAEARRMVADDRAKDAVRAFHTDWLKLSHLERSEKDDTLYPGFDENVKPRLEEELHSFLEHAVFEQGTLDDIFLSRTAFLDATTAAHYGVAGTFGEEPVAAELPETERAGLLTRAALLSMLAKADQSSPILRGVFVRDRLLCDPPPPPPDDVDPTPPEVDPSLSTRERFAQHVEDPSCAACHALIDPIGFGFENYGPVGEYRTVEGDGVMIDASGELLGTIDVDGSFIGAVELSHSLAESQQVELCFVQQWWRFAHGKNDSLDDLCPTDWLWARFNESGGDIEDLLVDITQTPTFRFRADTGIQNGGAP